MELLILGIEPSLAQGPAGGHVAPRFAMWVVWLGREPNVRECRNKARGYQRACRRVYQNRLHEQASKDREIETKCAGLDRRRISLETGEADPRPAPESGNECEVVSCGDVCEAVVVPVAMLANAGIGRLGAGVPIKDARAPVRPAWQLLRKGAGGYVPSRLERRGRPDTTMATAIRGAKQSIGGDVVTSLRLAVAHVLKSAGLARQPRAWKGQGRGS
jgi:hypothetical protein